MFDSRSAMDTMAQIITVLVDAKPAHAFPLFFKFCRTHLSRLLNGKYRGYQKKWGVTNTIGGPKIFLLK
jgi:hypothetical protein